MALKSRQAAGLLGIRRRSEGRIPRRCGQPAQVQRGISGGILPPDAGDGTEGALPARHESVDPQGLPLAPSAASSVSAGLEPEGPDLAYRAAKGSVRRARPGVPSDGSRTKVGKEKGPENCSSGPSL